MSSCCLYLQVDLVMSQGDCTWNTEGAKIVFDMGQADKGLKRPCNARTLLMKVYLWYFVARSPDPTLAG